LALAVCFISCDNGNEPNPDDGGDKPTEKLLRKITYENPNQKDIVCEFKYDTQSRVINVSMNAYWHGGDTKEEIAMTRNFSYSDKKIDVSGKYVGSIVNFNVVLNLNENKQIISENWTVEDSQRAFGFTYEYGADGKLQKVLSPQEGRTTKVSWSNGNIIQTIYNFVGEIPETDKIEYNNLTFSGNFDMNFLITDGIGDLDNYPLMPYLFDYYGISTKNLISKMGGRSFEYEISEDNYVTKCIAYWDGEAYRTLLFEYK